MNKERYHEFTDALVSKLQQDERVIGLIATGSMAATDHDPDEYSDHDFWMVVEPEHAEIMRVQPDWLPPYQPVVLLHRETAHGMQLIYEDGHLLEYAIFQPQELAVTRVNSYRVLIDRGDIAAQLTSIRERTHGEAAANVPTVEGQFNELLLRCLVGTLRHARGEGMSAHRFVKYFALQNLLTLSWRLVPPNPHAAHDNLDPFRRFEFAYPEYAAEVHRLLLSETPVCSAGFVTLAQSLMTQAGEPVPTKAVQTVLTRIHDLAQ